MFSLRKTYRLIRAFKHCFCDADGNLTTEGAVVLAYLRNEACGKGELGKDGSPYLYDGTGKFDANAAIFLQGKRRLFDLIIKYLAVDEVQVLNLIALGEQEKDNLIDNLNI